MFSPQAIEELFLESSVKYSYRELLEKIKDVTVLGTAQGVIHWDMETVMPPNAVEQRSLQLELLSRIGHQMSTNPIIGKLLQQIQASPEYTKLGVVERRNVYLINKNYLEQISLPEKLVADIAKQETVTVNMWKRAKARKDYSLVKGELKKLFELSRQAAEILMDVKEVKSPYDALIDQFEPQMTTQKITETFDKLQLGLRPLLDKNQEINNKGLDTKILYKPVPVEAQRQISQLIT